MERSMMAARSGQQSSANVTEALWDRYRSSGDIAARGLLLDRYLGLVHHVAREFAARSAAAEVDDLVSAGALGLVRALDSFDRSRGLAFSTYAVQRIRGAILDELRARDWIPRSVRTKGRKIAAAVDLLGRELGRAATPAEVAEALELDLESYWEWRGAVDGGTMVSFEAAIPSAEGRTLALEETLPDADAPLPGDELASEEERAGMRAALGRLPERERLVLSLYYYEELNLRQIAEVLKVTESRISQVRSQALRRLRGHLAGREEAAA